MTAADADTELQIIWKQGEPEYAVLPWAAYQELLQAAGRQPATSTAPVAEAVAAVPLSELSQLREDRGLTMEALAQETGISPVYLQLIEAGEREASDVLKRALGRVLGVSWQDD